VDRKAPRLKVVTKFTGKERDMNTAAMETGLDYFGARYFSGSQGRFTSPDWSERPQPVPFADFADPQTLNLYSYVRNNPLSRTDPDGHCCWTEIVAAVKYAKSVAYFKFEGGVGLSVNTKIGPTKVEIGAKRVAEHKFTETVNTKTSIGEIGAKVGVGPAKAGLAYGEEKLLAKDDQILLGQKTETKILLGLDLGNGKSSSWDAGVGVSVGVGLQVGAEIGVDGKKVAEDLLNKLAPPPPPPPQPPPPPPPTCSATGCTPSGS
jgi:RHS repeat-associated protein